MLTPQDVHHGRAVQRLADRAAVLAAAYAAHPERFPRGMPTPGILPAAAWINKPASGGCPAETDPPGCPRTDDLGPGQEVTTPEFEGIRSREEKELLAMVH